MVQVLHYRRLDRIVKIIVSKLKSLPENPLGVNFTLHYPDDRKNLLSDSEFYQLKETIDEKIKSDNKDCFITLLHMYITDKGMKSYDVYTASIIEKSYFHQILKGRYIPARDTAIRICLALKLNLEESTKLLETLGYTFFEKNRRDIIVMECLNFKTGLYTVELLLDKYKQSSLCKKSLLNNK